MSFAQTIRAWFQHHRGGLILPDGWFGRPYDSWCELTSLDESDSALTVILNSRLTLHFHGLKSVIADERTLTFGPFDAMRFDWRSVTGRGGYDHAIPRVSIATDRWDTVAVDGSHGTKE